MPLPEGNDAVEHAVEMVFGEVLHRRIAVGRVADREQVEPALDLLPAVEDHGDVVGKPVVGSGVAVTFVTIHLPGYALLA